MDTTMLVAIALVVAVVALAAAAFWQMRNRQLVKQRFGPEYERAVHDYGTESKAVSALAKRTERIKKYTIRPLSSREQQQYAAGWRETQAKFVDNPRGAVREADTLVSQVMETRGYPMLDFERRAEDLSVDHPHVVQNYRAAHAIAVSEAGGKASTEDLRRAFVCYRALFDDLLEAQSPAIGREVHA